eukprot:gene3602-2596_t
MDQVVSAVLAFRGPMNQVVEVAEVEFPLEELVEDLVAEAVGEEGGVEWVEMDGTFYTPEEYYDYGNSGYDYDGYNGSEHLTPDHASTAYYSSFGSDLAERIVTPAMVEADLAAVAALNPHAQEFVPTFTFR